MRSRATAYATRMHPTQLFSHVTAAQLQGLRMPERVPETELYVTSFPPFRAPRGAGVIGHRAERAMTELVGGLRVLSAIDTWCQLSAILSLDDLIAMGDGLVCRKPPLATMDSLRTAVSGYSGRGSRKLRDALPLVRPGTDSARETALRMLVTRAGFPSRR